MADYIIIAAFLIIFLILCMIPRAEDSTEDEDVDHKVMEEHLREGRDKNLSKM